MLNTEWIVTPILSNYFNRFLQNARKWQTKKPWIGQSLDLKFGEFFIKMKNMDNPKLKEKWAHPSIPLFLYLDRIWTFTFRSWYSTVAVLRWLFVEILIMCTNLHTRETIKHYFSAFSMLNLLPSFSFTFIETPTPNLPHLSGKEIKLACLPGDSGLVLIMYYYALTFKNSVTGK